MGGPNDEMNMWLMWQMVCVCVSELLPNDNAVNNQHVIVICFGGRLAFKFQHVPIQV